MPPSHACLKIVYGLTKELVNLHVDAVTVVVLLQPR